ncbi:MAG: type II secretion system protein GspM [Chromatiales bacterium]|nr:type II secretion system protein GspM [Chromatiales bacterium]
MIKPWRNYLARFDALSLRERVLVSAAVLAVLAFVIHALVVAPRQKAKVALAQQVVQQQTDLATIRTQLQGLSATGEGSGRRNPNAARNGASPDRTYAGAVQITGT